MNYAIAVVLGTGVLTWPLWQEAVPTNWGEWPLNIAVMAFALTVLKIIISFVQSRDDKFTAALASIEEKHQDALVDFGKMLKEVGDKTTAAAEATTRSIQEHDKNTKRAVKIIEKSALPIRRKKSK